MTTVVLTCLFCFFSGGVQGLTGFGAALVAIPLLSLVMGIKEAIPLTALNGLIITTTLAYTLRRLLDWSKILPLLIGSIPGIMLGAMFLKKADPVLISHLLGIVLLGISGFNLVCAPKPLHPHRIWGYIAGFFSGAINAIMGAGGPPAIIYTALTDWSKDEIRAILSGFFVLNAYITIGVYAGHGIITPHSLRLFSLSCWFVLLGTITGSKLSQYAPRRIFLKIVYCLLMFMGIMLLSR